MREIIVDSFAGGGGASLGISWAIGHGPDIAISHDREAVALHKANHPESRHYREDVWKVDPVVACAGRRVGLMSLSPDCKHFSNAKGGKPVGRASAGSLGSRFGGPPPSGPASSSSKTSRSSRRAARSRRTGAPTRSGKD